jgi:putative hydrolase of the HAD superfamily
MVVLFDLGGVVVDVDLNWSRVAWAATTGTSHTDFDRVFLDSGIKDQIDRGEMSESEALARIRELHSGAIEDHQIRHCWTSCLRTRPYSTQLVHAVARRSRCAVLSNTDPIHSAWIEEQSEIRDAISRWFYSYQCGSMKPEPRIFEVTLQTLGVSAEEALLIDDREENIAAAQRLGMETIHYTSFESVCEGLAGRDLIPANWLSTQAASES